MLSNRTKNQLDVVQFPYVPDRVSQKDLRDGVYLYPADERQKLLTYLKQNYAGKNVRISKKELAQKKLPAQYSVVVYDQQYYLLYLGRQRERHAGAGAFGVVKYLQNLETGHFDDVVKVFSEWHTPPRAYQTNRTDIGTLRTYLTDEYQYLHMLGDASASAPIFRHSNGKGSQLLKPQKTKEGMNYKSFIKQYLQLNGNKIKDPQYILGILINMCESVRVLHQEKKLLHRDIKRENFIVNPQTTEVKLIDFGFATSINTVFDEGSNRLGTPSSLAPEIMDEEIPGYSDKSDAFGLGATIATGFKMTDPLSGGILQYSDGSTTFLPLSIAKKTSEIQNDPLLSGIYNICEGLLYYDPDMRFGVTAARDAFQRLQKLCNTPVKLLAFNLADYVGFTKKDEMIDFLAKHGSREIIFFMNEEDKDNPLLRQAAIALTRLAQKQGYIVHAEVFVVPDNTKHAELLPLVADHVAKASPQIKYECSLQHFIPRRHQKYLDALVNIIEQIPSRTLKKKYTEKLAELRESGAPVWKIVAELKLLAPKKSNKSVRGNSGFFGKIADETAKILDVINTVDLEVAFSTSRLAALLLRLAPDAMQAKIN